MFFSRPSKIKKQIESTVSPSEPIILIVDDDPEQLELLGAMVTAEIRRLMGEANISLDYKEALMNAKVIKVGDQQSMRKVAQDQSELLFCILDCQLPEKKGGVPNDQFAVQNHVITGQHKSVDILLSNHPRTPILLVSALDRFRHPVTRYYRSKYNVNISFARKSEPERMVARINQILKSSG